VDPRAGLELHAIISDRLDRAVEFIALNFTELRAELTAQISGLEAKISGLERTMERNTEALRLVQLGLANLNRWADALDKEQAAFGQNYFKQQRAIEDRQRRMAALERQQQPPQH